MQKRSLPAEIPGQGMSRTCLAYIAMHTEIENAIRRMVALWKSALHRRCGFAYGNPSGFGR